MLYGQFDNGVHKWELVCNPLSRVYFGKCITEIHHFTLLKTIIGHNSEQNVTKAFRPTIIW